MNLSVTEHRTLIKALELTARRYESQARFYAARPDRYGPIPVNTAERQAEATRSLQQRIAALRARHDVLRVA